MYFYIRTCSHNIITLTGKIILYSDVKIWDNEKGKIYICRLKLRDQKMTIVFKVLILNDLKFKNDF